MNIPFLFFSIFFWNTLWPLLKLTPLTSNGTRALSRTHIQLLDKPGAVPHLNIQIENQRIFVYTRQGKLSSYQHLLICFGRSARKSIKVVDEWKPTQFVQAFQKLIFSNICDKKSDNHVWVSPFFFEFSQTVLILMMTNNIKVWFESYRDNENLFWDGWTDGRTNGSEPIQPKSNLYTHIQACINLV